MSLEKAELKQVFAKDLGEQFDSQLKAIEAEIHRLEGAASGLLQAVEKLELLKTYWHKEAEESKIPAEAHQAAIKAIDECEGSLRNLAETAKVHRLIKSGEANATRGGLDTCRKIITTEAAKAQALLTAIDAGEVVLEPSGKGKRPPRRATGQHPGKNIAQRRREQESDAKNSG